MAGYSEQKYTAGNESWRSDEFALIRCGTVPPRKMRLHGGKSLLICDTTLSRPSLDRRYNGSHAPEVAGSPPQKYDLYC